LVAGGAGSLRQVDQYKAKLMAADEPRRGDLDGRGNLTQQGLNDFCKFSLRTCVGQVAFMEGPLEPSELLRRIEMVQRRNARQLDAMGAVLGHGFIL
jgi:hypothetical protein